MEPDFLPILEELYGFHFFELFEARLGLFCLRCFVSESLDKCLFLGDNFTLLNGLFFELLFHFVAQLLVMVVIAGEE